MAVSFTRKFLPYVLSLPAVLGPLAAGCFAPQPIREPAIGEREALAESYLDDRLATWQKRLKLEHWNIDLIQAKPTELRAGTLGNIHWNEYSKTAKIRVLAAWAYAMPYHAALRDMEFTVVHELIHLELASLPRSEASRSDEEHAVNHMAEALLALERGSPVSADKSQSGGAKGQGAQAKSELVSRESR